MKKKVIVICLLLIVAGVMLMILPKTDVSKDIGVVGNAQIEEPAVPETDPIVSEAGAIKIITDRQKGSSVTDIVDFSQEFGEGGWMYQGTVKSDRPGVLYAFQIDADLGTLLQWEPIKEERK